MYICHEMKQIQDYSRHRKWHSFYSINSKEWDTLSPFTLTRSRWGPCIKKSSFIFHYFSLLLLLLVYSVNNTTFYDQFVVLRSRGPHYFILRTFTLYLPMPTFFGGRMYKTCIDVLAGKPKRVTPALDMPVLIVTL